MTPPQVAFFCVLLAAHSTGISVFDFNDNPRVSTENCDPDAKSQDIGDRATCTFTTHVDVDSTRIPPEIASVKCNCRDSLCSKLGDFRCQEVTETIKVAFVNETSSVVRQRSKVTVACVCAINRSAGALRGLKRTGQVVHSFG
ncbi:uncharacterized protein LOC121833644 [Ixodes scapularis]|uniref:uncharacterized protein LOC121833644 n=1 Tax=Ixodes scapularis TaxID=6945 RepID=UPI001C38AE0B|nr:uncharacterized protein LOC121833644 [Ixodes scapularis]